LKNSGIVCGTFLEAYNTSFWLNFSKFNFWELCLIAFYVFIKILFWGAIGGIVAMIISEIFENIKYQWTGKKKELKPPTLAD
jgi:quinol-cytochrome oxidoreductase complex cytochrome b subunit